MNIDAPGVDLTSLVLTLVFIIGLIFACAWFVRRISGGNRFNNRLIKVVAVLPLGAKEKLVLIETGGQQILLGVTPGQITTLKEFSEPLSDGDTIESSHFSEKLKTLLKGSAQWQTIKPEQSKD
jgi:flagellar protein FliO/FliZ